MSGRTRANSSKALGFLGLVFLGVGVVLLCLGGVLYLTTAAFIENALTALGIVVDLEQRDSLFYPVVSFLTRSGEEIIFSSPLGSNPTSFHKGDRSLSSMTQQTQRMRG